MSHRLQLHHLLTMTITSYALPKHGRQYTMSNNHSIFSFSIAGTLKPYVPAAIVRLGYLHPNWDIEFSENSIHVQSDACDEKPLVQREVFHCVYREKVLAETLDIRRDLLALVAGK